MSRIAHSSPQTLRLLEVLLAEPARWRYGYDLTRETALASGTMYPILMRLCDQHLLEAAWEPSDQPGRPPRHIYRLTPDGVALARDRLATSGSRAGAPARGRPAVASMATRPAGGVA